MNKLLFGLGLIICLFSCKKNPDDSEQSYLPQDRTTREIHNYTYDKDGKILNDRQVTYHLLRDVITDTTKTLSEYSYERGKLIKIKVDEDIPEQSLIKIFRYNAIDSLTLELWIEHNGDTTYISKTDFDERGNRVLEKTQRLWDKRTFNEMIKEPNKIIYDTLFSWKEYDFESNNHFRTRAKNKFGEVEWEALYFYENGKNIRTELYNFLGTIKYLHSTQTYDYSKYSKGEYKTIDKDGLPIESFSVELRNGKLYKSTWTYDSYLTILFYDDSGKIIKDLDFSFQRVYEYKYDSRGNKVEVFEYPMPDSEFNNQYKAMTNVLKTAQN